MGATTPASGFASIAPLLNAIMPIGRVAAGMRHRHYDNLAVFDGKDQMVRKAVNFLVPAIMSGGRASIGKLFDKGNGYVYFSEKLIA
jgi:hypothetical protein